MSNNYDHDYKKYLKYKQKYMMLSGGSLTDSLDDNAKVTILSWLRTKLGNLKVNYNHSLNKFNTLISGDAKKRSKEIPELWNINCIRLYDLLKDIIRFKINFKIKNKINTEIKYDINEPFPPITNNRAKETLDFMNEIIVKYDDLVNHPLTKPPPAHLTSTQILNILDNIYILLRDELLKFKYITVKINKPTILESGLQAGLQAVGRIFSSKPTKNK